MVKKMEINPGDKFGRLTIIREDLSRIKHRYVECRCDCGKVKTTSFYPIKLGIVVSCGCYHKEMIGDLRRSHGYTGTRLYNTWKNIKARCLYPNSRRYNDYGGRGISICKEWELSFVNFKNWALNNGYTDKLSIERKNNNENYCPDNCEWITNATQQLNRRDNRNISFKGETKTLSEWAKEIGMCYKTLEKRLNTWPIEKAMITPVSKKHQHGFKNN